MQPAERSPSSRLRAHVQDCSDRFTCPDLVTADAGPAEPGSTGAGPEEHVMTVIRRATKSMATLRPLLATAVAAVALTVPSHGQPDLAGRRAAGTTTSAHIPPAEAAPTKSSGVRPPRSTR